MLNFLIYIYMVLYARILLHIRFQEVLKSADNFQWSNFAAI